MRHDMKDLSNQLATRPPSFMVQGRDGEEGASVPLTKENVESLEKEITELKSKKRPLRQQIEDVASQSAKPPLCGRSSSQGVHPQDPFVQAHIKELNETIGALRQEKLELSAQVKKHQATVDHLQGSLNQAYKEVRQKQLSVDQLQYELTTQSRLATDELNTLKQRVTGLELQLVQTRREADEYFKSGLERNAEATSLGNQLSSLTVELASQRRGGSSFNPQAAVVKQLQDEVLRLRTQLASGKQTSDRDFLDPVSLGGPPTSNMARLHSKLQAAARRISHLSQEKEQLIQMGNRLRAELAKYTDGKIPAPLLESHELVSRDKNSKDNVPVEKHATIPPANQWTSSPAYDQPLFTSSSEGQASLQEIWKMLDAEESFQSRTPRKVRPSSPQRHPVSRDLEPDHIPVHDSPERDVFALKGRRTEAQCKPTKQQPELSKKAAGKAKITPKKLKVRNCNIKDDPS